MKDRDMMNKTMGASALPEDMLDGVVGGLRSVDWRTCNACGYNGGGFMYTDDNRNVKCPQCGAKQSAW